MDLATLPKARKPDLSTSSYLTRRAAGKQTRAVCSMFGAMSRVISLTWKRLRLESFNRTDVTVLTSVPFMIAMMLPEHPLFSLFIRIV